jgi:hypothetical protein
MKKIYALAVSVIAALMLVLFISPETAVPMARAQQSVQHTSLALYDNFDRQFINPSKWSAPWQCGPPTMECVREIQNGQLRLRVRGYGATDTNTGTQFSSSEVDLTNSSVTDISAQVLVRKSTPQDCPTNPGVAHSQAMVKGTFFNGGGGTAEDDVQAFLQLDRYNTTVDAGGFLYYHGQFFDNVWLGSVNVGEQVILELLWDQPNHQFVVRLFRPANHTKVEQSMPYTISDTTPAVAPSKSLSANVFPANCTGKSTSADLDVLFDNIMTN